MEINALIMDVKDNVVTCVKDVAAGQEVTFRRGSDIITVTAVEAIPYCHKMALEDIACGTEVIKYGELIGEADKDIKKGCLVDHTNIHSVPRDYESEMLPL